MKGGVGQFILVVILIGVFGTASIFGYMMFSNAEADIDFTNATNETNATYTATSNVVMFGMSFMNIIVLLFVVALVFVAAFMLVKFW